MYRSEVYEAVAGVPGVDCVRDVELTAGAPGERIDAGIGVPPTALVYLDDATVSTAGDGDRCGGVVAVTFPFVGTHTAADWAEWGGQNHAVVGGGVTLATADRLQYVSPTWLVSEPDLPFSVVDLDVDDCGDVWLLSDSGTIRRYDPDRDDLRRIHCTWDAPPARPRGIAVTADTVYVAAGRSGADSETASENAEEATGDGGGGWIHAFSRHLIQTRWVADAPYADPVALARAGEAVSVLDRGDDGTDPFLATVGRGGTPVSTSTGFRSPVDLAVDEAGDRYVLDRDAAGETPTIERVSPTQPTVETAVPTDEFVTEGTPLSPATIAAGAGDLLVGTADAFETEPSLFRHRSNTGDFERLTGYTGPVAGLLLRRGGAVREPGLYVVGDDGRALSFLPATERTRINPDTGRYDGQAVTRLDAGESTQWHRVTASRSTGETGTQVRVRYYATDDGSLGFHEPGVGPVASLERVDGIGPTIADRLRAAYVRGLGELVGLTPERLATLAGTDDYPVSTERAGEWIAEAETILAQLGDPGDLDWRSVGPPDPRDALLDDAVGRYLWVKIELVGTAAAAPRVDTFRAYFPRQSYLRYLPSIYERDPQSAAFLERFLSLFESVFTDVEEEISAATRYLDPDGVPGEALSWLGGWLALSPDETWSTADERTLVRRAPDLFKARGTRQGLRELLSIYLDDPAFPPAWEWALDRQAAAIETQVAAGELSADAAERLNAVLDRPLYIWEQDDLSCIDEPAVRTLYEKLLPCPQCFAVLVWPFLDEPARREVERLVDTTSPAHATGNVIPLEPSFRLTGEAGDTGHHTFLGVNSALADRDFELDSSSLGTDSRLTDHERSGQVGTHRLGIDTRTS
ncbi:phage tail protein [Salinigranum sp. GCM10025319]|uniref:phage tail protein n=1 Tax=Salinigranum sp. GCM10025319 TaxID=3252687 RepID=UPI00360E7383